MLSGNNSETGALTNNGPGGTLLITGSNTSGPVGMITGMTGGNGTLGPISAGNLVTSAAAPGIDNPGTNVGTQQVASANLSNGGNLNIHVAGYATAGVNYDQLNVTGALTLGGTSTLTLDLTGLGATGTATGVVLFGGRTGYLPVFSQVAVVNNPNNYSVQLIYNAGSIDVVVLPGGSVAAGGSSGLLALGTVSANVSEVISNFRAPTTGTYYVAVSGAASTGYSLVITRNAAFDTEPNDSFALAQNIDGARGALGAISPITPTTLTFGELPLQPVNGLSYKGVTFGYSVNGVASTAADYNSSGPGVTAYTSDPSLVGNTAGALLTFTFAHLTPTLQFGVALSTSATVTSGATVTLFDAIGNVISSSSVLVSPLGFTFSSGLFSYSGPIAVGRVTLSFNSTAAAAFAVDNLTYSTLPDQDFYSLPVNVGDPLVLTTSIPSEGSGAFNNTLDPEIALYDPSGALVASGVVQPDGRNQQINYTALTTGLYRVQVISQGNTTGEYALSISGATGAAAPFQVVSTSPANGAVVETTAPITYTVDFNSNYLVTSVTAADLLVDGVINPTAVTLVDGNTLRFTLPGLGNGVHTVVIAAGAITDVEGTPLSAFAATFTIDTTTPPRVIATSIAPNAAITPGSLIYQVTFSKPMLVNNLSTDDFTLHGNFVQAAGVNYAPSSDLFDSTGTILTLNYTGLPVDNYTLTLIAGSSGGTNFTDQNGLALDGEFSGTFPSGNGVAGGNFVIGFNMVQGTVAYAPPLVATLPQGSLVYTSAPATSVITSAGDTDGFTLAVDPGQTITVLVTPTGTATLQPTVSLFDPSNKQLGSTASATAAGRAPCSSRSPLPPVAPTRSWSEGPRRRRGPTRSRSISTRPSKQRAWGSAATTARPRRRT